MNYSELNSKSQRTPITFALFDYNHLEVILSDDYCL